MAKVLVRLYATLREAAGSGELHLEASTLRELLETLSDHAGPALREHILSYGEEDGGVVVLHNGRNVPPGQASTLTLSDGDEVAMFPPVSGG